MAGLAKAIKRHGGRIYAGTEAKEIKGGTTAEIKTNNRKKISAGAVVVATNTPVNDWVTMHTKQAAYRSYVIGVPIPCPSPKLRTTLNPLLVTMLQAVAHAIHFKRILNFGEGHV
jgi:glycine/D-amino acid oxidase-like deaminating enzyme